MSRSHLHGMVTKMVTFTALHPGAVRTTSTLPIAEEPAWKLKRISVSFPKVKLSGPALEFSELTPKNPTPAIA